MVIMVSGIACGRVHTMTMTAATESCKMASILQQPNRSSVFPIVSIDSTEVGPAAGELMLSDIALQLINNYWMRLSMIS